MYVSTCSYFSNHLPLAPLMHADSFGHTVVVHTIQSLACGFTQMGDQSACVLLFAFAHTEHRPTHMGKGGMNEVIRSKWFARGITQVKLSLVDRYMLASKPGKKHNSVKHDHLKPTSGTIVKMALYLCPVVKVISIFLVMADMFSQCVGAYPMRKEDAKTAVKCLLKEVIPRSEYHRA